MKSLAVEVVQQQGYSVLNADAPLTHGIKKAFIILFTSEHTMSPEAYELRLRKDE